jgi:Ca-activated chloride channel family protein
MKSPRRIACTAAALLFSFFAIHAHPQEPQPVAPATPTPSSQSPASPATPQNAQGPKIVVPVNLVIVPVTVKDKSGRLVPDLHKEEFRIFEDDVEQTVDRFIVEAFPLSMVVLVDNDLKQRDGNQVEASLRAIVAGMSVKDEAFICRFDQYFHEGKGFSTDQDKLLTELKRTRLDMESSAPPSGGPFEGPAINNQPAPGAPNVPASMRVIKGQITKTLDDAVYNAALLLKDRGRDRRKIILLISDGQNGAKFNTYSYKNTIEVLLRYGVSVYSIAAGNAYFDRKFSRLVDYAHDSGGDVYFGVKHATFEQLYSRVTEEARNQYTLAYSPRGTDRGKDYHSIEVRVTREGLNILTRQGYYSGAAPR